MHEATEGKRSKQKEAPSRYGQPTRYSDCSQQGYTSSDTVVNDHKDVPLMITLTADGRLFLNDEPISGDGLTAVLTKHPRESVVVLRADRVAVLERFVGVVDEVRVLGFRQVSLEVLRS